MMDRQMSEQKTDLEPEEAGRDLRGKLIGRLAVAGTLVAVLLGALAFFDHLASHDDDEDAVVYSRPVPVAPKKPVSQPVTPTENLPEPPAEKAVEAPAAEKPAEKPAEKVAEKPVEASPPAPAPAAQPVMPREVMADPRGTQRPEKRAAAPVAPVVQKPAPAVQPSAPLSATPKVPLDERAIHETGSVAPATRQPSARVIETRQAPVIPPSGLSRLFNGFVLQAGVFNSPQRAEELHAKLTLSGVPSTLETRVQVGPFKTRQEAETAQAKLRELGIDSVLVAPRR